MNKNVTIIPAKRRKGNTIKELIRPKLRVAAYCRVSTDSEEQATSYNTQVEHYTDFIKRNPDWDFAGVFADDGVSGTYTKKRDGFNNMIDECMTGNIDMIITKSISRFARNTIDCLKFIRKLKEKNISVFFEKENINTMDAKGEVMLTIMASLAQQESESLSQNVKLGFQYKFQQGKMTINHNRFLGYTKDEDGNIIIDEDDALIVKRIYREYLEGSSLKQIANGLEKDKLLTGAGNNKWGASSIKRILKNEKYIGDALLQKTYTIDFLNKKRVVNNGIVPQYYVENSHEAIIPRDIFLRVQEEMQRRTNLHSGENKKRRVYSGKYALSSVVCCSKCGDIYRRIVWNNRGKRSIVWRCCNRVENGPEACDSRTINEEELKEITIKAINFLIDNKERINSRLKESIKKTLLHDNSNKLLEIETRLKELQNKLLKESKNDNNYDCIVEDIYLLQEEKQHVLSSAAELEGVKLRIKELNKFIDVQKECIKNYDDRLVRKIIEKIIIHEENHQVIFKSGIDIYV